MFETIIVLSILALVAAGLMGMQSKLWTTQSVSRDQTAGLELIRGCAERLLAVRRQTGFTSVTTTLCNGMGTTGGFPANPSVAMTNDAGSAITTCASTFCTVTVSISNSAGTVAIRPLTLQLSSY